MFDGYEVRKIKKNPGGDRDSQGSYPRAEKIQLVIQRKPHKINNRKVFVDMAEVIAY
jgi:hypothetical protein